MRNEWILFGFISAYLYVAAGVYALWTTLTTSVEWAGTAALFVSGSLAGIIWLYFWLVYRRIDPRPEDREQAEIADGAGVVGSFSPASYWPLGIGLGAAVIAFGLAADQIWLALAGLGVVLATTAGLLFENYVLHDRRRG